MSNTTPITVYGADWCSDCRRAKNVLTAAGIPFDYLDIDRNPAFLAQAVEISGARAIPVVVFPDGSHLVEPSNEALLAAARRTVSDGAEAEPRFDLGGGD